MPRATTAIPTSSPVVITAGSTCTTYAAVWERTRRLGALLRMLGVKPGDRVATLAMNSDRHLELYYAITGIGAICNTINPRLSPDDIGWIAAHAEDGLIFADPIFLPIVQQIAPTLVPQLRAVILLEDEANLPTDCALPAGVAVHVYETLMELAPPPIDFDSFDENTAALLCYTSGTTGRPKGAPLLAPLYRIARHGHDIGGRRLPSRR